MAQRLKSGKELYDVNYFFAIADEMERVYRNLIEARKALIEIQELSVDRISTRSALEKTAKIVERVVGSPR